MNDPEALHANWREAAAELGIVVHEVGDAILVTQFGSSAGMLCAIRGTRDGQEQLRREAESRRAGWSALGRSYLRYERDLFP
jgi:hypothetical protein